MRKQLEAEPETIGKATYHGQKGCSRKEGIPDACGNASLVDDTRGNGGHLLVPELHGNKGNGEDAE